MAARRAVLGGGPAFADGSGRIPDMDHLCAGACGGAGDGGLRFCHRGARRELAAGDEPMPAASSRRDWSWSAGTESGWR